jgi:hypothetical protein
MDFRILGTLEVLVMFLGGDLFGAWRAAELRTDPSRATPEGPR